MLGWSPFKEAPKFWKFRAWDKNKWTKMMGLPNLVAMRQLPVALLQQTYRPVHLSSAWCWTYSIIPHILVSHNLPPPSKLSKHVWTKLWFQHPNPKPKTGPLMSLRPTGIAHVIGQLLDQNRGSLIWNQPPKLHAQIFFGGKFRFPSRNDLQRQHHWQIKWIIIRIHETDPWIRIHG